MQDNNHECDMYNYNGMDIGNEGNNHECDMYNYNGMDIGDEGTSCRVCNKNLASNQIASQYQRQKIIQNTVRVKSSLYTMNLAALTSYHKPNTHYRIVDIPGSNYTVSPGVNWNQMSDQSNPSRQIIRTKPGLRPGALSPGGSGVDIKHNSYERYLNRLKGKGPLKQDIIPLTYGENIEFNRALPIYGGKTIKTGIISGCDCKVKNATILNNKTNNNEMPLLYV